MPLGNTNDSSNLHLKSILDLKHWSLFFSVMSTHSFILLSSVSSQFHPGRKPLFLYPTMSSKHFTEAEMKFKRGIKETVKNSLYFLREQ